MTLKTELAELLALSNERCDTQQDVISAAWRLRNFMRQKGPALMAAVEDGEKWRLAYSLDAVTDPAEHGKLVEAIELRFRSGNPIPVERAHITAKEWSWIKDRLNELRAARASENKTP